MSDVPLLRRRNALRAIGASAVAALSGCSVLDGTDDTDAFDGETFHFDGGDSAAFETVLQDLADEPGGTLEIAAGSYEFDPRPSAGERPWAHFQLADFGDARIRGNDATISVTDPNAVAMQFLRGGTFELQNLTFDYSVPPFTQATIRSIDRGSRSLVVELDGGYPALDHEMFDRAQVVRASVHEPDGAFVSGIWNPREVWKEFASTAHRGDRRWELTLDNRSTLTGLQEGRRLAVLARGPHHALQCLRVDEPTFEAVTVHTSPGISLVIGKCGAPVVNDCTLAPDPDADRMVASNADGIHVYNCRAGVTVEGCRIERQEDDALVVESTMAAVGRVVDDHTLALADPSHKFVLERGDVLAAMGPEGTRLGSLPPVESGEAGRPTTPDRIRFEGSIDDAISRGDYLLNTDYGNDEFAIEDNVVRDCMARLVRIGAGPGEVANNTLAGSSNQIVFLESDTRGTFPPKGWVEGVTVRDNEIRRAGLNGFANANVAAVHVVHRSGLDADGRPHRDVEILDNDIAETANVGIRCADVEDVRIEDNDLSDLNRLEYPQVADEAGYGMGFENVDGATVASNRVAGGRDVLSAFAWTRNSDRVSLSDNQLVIDGESVEPRVVRE